MPGMIGIDLARQLRVRAPGVPVLLATGYSEQMIGEGIDEFDVLVKPYGAEALSLALRKTLSIS
jgi:DNA-binding LytR/AlgR family response regulator